VLLVPLAFAGWFGMNNLLTVSPNIGSTAAALGKILLLYGVAFITAAIGLYLYLPKPTGLGLLNMWIAMPLIIVGTLLAMKLVAFGDIEAEPEEAVRDFQGQAHLVDDAALYRHFVHSSAFPTRCRCRST